MGLDVILQYPVDVAVDAMGDIYVSEFDGNRITRISYQQWDPKRHKKFPPSVKGTIRELIMLHSFGDLSMIPRDVIFILCKYVAS